MNIRLQFSYSLICYSSSHSHHTKFYSLLGLFSDFSSSWCHVWVIITIFLAAGNHTPYHVLTYFVLCSFCSSVGSRNSSSKLYNYPGSGHRLTSFSVHTLLSAYYKYNNHYTTLLIIFCNIAASRAMVSGWIEWLLATDDGRGGSPSSGKFARTSRIRAKRFVVRFRSPHLS